MEDRTCYCRNPRCVRYGQVGREACLKFRGHHRHATRYTCRGCGALVSAVVKERENGRVVEVTTRIV